MISNEGGDISLVRSRTERRGKSDFDVVFLYKYIKYTVHVGIRKMYVCWAKALTSFFLVSKTDLRI